ncbi:MAG: M20/M25/M40 family metallo-hydrolase [Planctomycetia bacterium]|nr:M20/M25/M40 family metallo-hydrolase [Planctomycetia bacterium]
MTPSISVAAGGDEVVERRLLESVKYLASDELEGRGVGTKGLDLAADFLARQFREAGLKTDLYDGSPFQRFKMTVGASLGPNNQLALTGPPEAGGKEPQRIELKLGEQFNPLAIGGSGKFDLPLVFVGYGITGKEEKYDDYANVDVKGKAVIILRHEPQQANPHSVFDGTKTSQYAPYKRKLSNAYEHGAAAVIFCTDDFEIQKNISQLRKRWQAAVDSLIEEDVKFKAIVNSSADDWKKHQDEVQRAADDIQKLSSQLQAVQDPLLGFDGAGPDLAEGRTFPVLFCRRSVLDQVLQSAAGTSLTKLEKEIDNGPTPQSRVLTNWRAAGETSVERQEVEVKNIVGVLEGEGPRANETIVIGAHYDHLGWGGTGSAAPGVHEIHNGADDNASGTATLVDVARQLAGRGKKLPRRLVFIAFTGEERGLIGSARYVRNPLVPLESTVAMLNMDMVGRLQDEKLIVHGTGTASEFDGLADRFGAQFGFHITKKPGGFGPSDHSSFYAAKVPVLFFFTGSHKDYHRPSDDVDKLNISGMRRVGGMVAELALALAEAPDRPHYQEAQGGSESIGGDGDRPYFGSIPDFSQEETGYALTGVTKGGPAERAGIKAGDVIIQFGDSKIGNLEDFDSALRKFKAGDKVPVVVKRGAGQVRLEVTLDPPR